MNTDQESRFMAMEGYHNKLLSLHRQAWDDYKGKRSEHREMQIELSQHQEYSRNLSGDRSAEAPDVQHYFS